MDCPVHFIYAEVATHAAVHSAFKQFGGSVPHRLLLTPAFPPRAGNFPKLFFRL